MAATSSLANVRCARRGSGCTEQADLSVLSETACSADDLDRCLYLRFLAEGPGMVGEITADTPFSAWLASISAQGGDTALTLLDLACSAGIITPCAMLADMRPEMCGSSESNVDVLEWGCDAGHHASCWIAGMHMQALDAPIEQIAPLFQAACEHGVDPACATAGEHALMGAGREQDVDEALEMLETGCAAGQELACIYLADFLPRDGGGPAFEPRAGRRGAQRSVRRRRAGLVSDARPDGALQRRDSRRLRPRTRATAGRLRPPAMRIPVRSWR